MFKLLLAFLEPNSGSPLSQAGALILRIAAGLFVAGFHGLPKMMQGMLIFKTGHRGDWLRELRLWGYPFPFSGRSPRQLHTLLEDCS